MTGPELLARLQERGLAVTATPAGLRLTGADESALTPSLREEVRAHRDELLELLGPSRAEPPRRTRAAAASSSASDGSSSADGSGSEQPGDTAPADPSAASSDGSSSGLALLLGMGALLGVGLIAVYAGQRARAEAPPAPPPPADRGPWPGDWRLPGAGW